MPYYLRMKHFRSFITSPKLSEKRQESAEKTQSGRKTIISSITELQYKGYACRKTTVVENWIGRQTNWQNKSRRERGGEGK